MYITVPDDARRFAQLREYGFETVKLGYKYADEALEVPVPVTTLRFAGYPAGEESLRTILANAVAATLRSLHMRGCNALADKATVAEP